jgi:YqaJ-like viral recombinase domain
MKFHNVPHGHINWFRLRMGRVTASEMGNLLTPEFKPRTGEMFRTYLFSKLAELWRGKPLIHTGSWATEQGQVREEFAIPFLALEKEWKIDEGGFIETDDGKAGCSPDGIVGREFGVEVKCPEPVSHVRWLIDGVLPKDYIVQVHASLFVSGFDKWVFMSFHNDFPPLILEVRRDEAIIAKIGEAVKRFHEQLNEAKEKMKRWSHEQ